MVSNKKRGSIYTGMTNNLIRRITQHKQRKTKSFTRRYNLDKLVWYESFPSAIEAIRREKEIKGWVRRKKIALIESMNPEWKDLFEDVVKKYGKQIGRMTGMEEDENKINGE
jgi:putative endonuclease